MVAKPFANGFLTDVTQGLDDVRLRGVECEQCGVTLFGVRSHCENCGSEALDEVEFGREGTVYSYTVQRHSPSPPFKMGPTDDDEWEPRPVAYVDLPEGARILAVLDCDPEAVSIGDTVTLSVETGWTDDEGDDVVVYTFEPEVAA